MVSRTPYSLKVVCLKWLLSLRVYKLQEDVTPQGSLQAEILTMNPAAAIVESGFPCCSAMSSVKLSLFADEIHATWVSQSHRVLKCWAWGTNPANLAPRSVLPHPTRVGRPCTWTPHPRELPPQIHTAAGRVSVFVSKSILSDISIATPVLFLTFAWNTFSILSLSACMFLWIWSKSLSGGKYMGHFFGNNSASLCLLIELFSSHTFKVIIDRYVVIAAVLIVFWLLLYFFFCSLLLLHSLVI